MTVDKSLHCVRLTKLQIRDIIEVLVEETKNSWEYKYRWDTIESFVIGLKSDD